MKRPTSKAPGKQRKFLHDAPLHLKRKILSSHLSKELKAKYTRRSLAVRKGDEVHVMRGKFKGKTGKNPSKLKIINLNLDDKRRIKILERKGVKSGSS
ncbi:MAG: 50S ribosomal protein L24 [Candidatus Aenigmarchaeota archaeon]|nr:50S ribosomal protein L24 [Candidatus Aenigmarchaeota archaeon]